MSPSHMRLVAMVVTGVLAMAVIAEGAYIFVTRGQLASLERRLESLAVERDSAGRAEPSRRGSEGYDTDLDDDRPAATVRPPRFTLPALEASPAADRGNPLPLPPVLDSEQAREQLRQFVLAQLERERQEGRERQAERRAEREMRWRERAAKEMNLSPVEVEKFNQILNNSQSRRDQLQARIQAGELEGPAIRSAIQALREDSSRELRGLLGDQRVTKYEELRRSEGRGGPGGAGRFLGGVGRGPGAPGGPPTP